MNKKQKIILILGLGLLLLLPLTKIVKAQETTTGLDIMTGHYILAWLGSLLVKAASFLVNLAIGLNFKILDTPFITDGWEIARDLANLGFVLFIIVIAIATILRMQQYGAKNTLGKLIAVALLVNFSLVFAGVFIDFSNMLTNFFIKNVTTVGPGELAGALANAFNPAQILNTELEGGKPGGWVEKLKGLIDVIIDPAKGLSALLTWIGGIFFVITFTLVLAFTLFALAIMFLIRFVSLSILLVLLPLACLFFILPATKKLWDQWWNNFMKWIIFAPVASFFLYLGVKMLIDTSSRSQMDELTKLAQGQGTINSLNFGDTLPNADLFSQMAKGVVFVGFVLGGLIAANSMGIAGSRAFMGMAQATGKWARGAIGRAGLAVGTRPLRGKWGQEITERMQRSRFMPINRLGTALSGIGVEQGARLAKAAEGRVNKRFTTDKSLAMALPTLRHEEQIAAVKRLMKNKTMNLVEERVLDSMIGNKDTKNVFKRYGAGKEYADLEKAAGRSTAMFTGKDEKGNPITREEAMKQLFKSYNLKDFESLRKKSITEDADAAARIKAIIDTNPGALGKLMPKFSGEDFDKFTGGLIEAIPEIIEKEKKDLKEKLEKGGKEATEAIEVIKGYLGHYYPTFSQSFNKNLANRIAGWGGEYAPPAETTT